MPKATKADYAALRDLSADAGRSAVEAAAVAVRRIGSDQNYDCEPEFRTLLRTGPPVVRGACAVVLVVYWRRLSLRGYLAEELRRAVASREAVWSDDVEQMCLDLVSALCVSHRDSSPSERAEVARELVPVLEAGTDWSDLTVLRLAALRAALELIGAHKQSRGLRPETLDRGDELVSEISELIGSFKQANTP